MFWLGIVGVVVVVMVTIPIAIAAIYVEDWSRDLSINHAETTKSHSHQNQRPFEVEQGRTQVSEKVLEVVQRFPNWSIESTTQESERTVIRATRTTGIMKFVDDITIYVNGPETNGKTTITATSQSRVGKGDLGQNPRNLRQLMSAIREAYPSSNP